MATLPCAPFKTMYGPFTWLITDHIPHKSGFCFIIYNCKYVIIMGHTVFLFGKIYYLSIASVHVKSARYDFNVLHHCHVYDCWHINNINRKPVGILINHLHSKFHILCSSGSLAIDVKLKAEWILSYGCHFSFIHQKKINYLNRSYTVLLPYTISWPYINWYWCYSDLESVCVCHAVITYYS
jgi:hypothetical protein